MPNIEVTPLGAGQDVGKSCILVSINGKNIMLDCGMHMGFDDERRLTIDYNSRPHQLFFTNIFPGKSKAWSIRRSI